MRIDRITDGAGEGIVIGVGAVVVGDDDGSGSAPGVVATALIALFTVGRRRLLVDGIVTLNKYLSQQVIRKTRYNIGDIN